MANILSSNALSKGPIKSLSKVSFHIHFKKYVENIVTSTLIFKKYIKDNVASMLVLKKYYRNLMISIQICQYLRSIFDVFGT